MEGSDADWVHPEDAVVSRSGSHTGGSGSGGSNASAGMALAAATAGIGLVGGSGSSGSPTSLPDAVMACVRIRPLNDRERAEQRGERIQWQYNDKSMIDDNDVGRKAYNYDRVFAPGSTNAEVYRACARPVVQVSE
jgi:hypothetical protein